MKDFLQVFALLSLWIDLGKSYRGTWQMREALRMRDQSSKTPAVADGELITSKEESSPFPYHVTLDPYGGVHLNWTTSPDDDLITFHLHAQVTSSGTLGIGFSDRGTFNNADLLLLWTDADGNHHFMDTWTDGEGIVHEDQNQDFNIISANKISRWKEPDVLALTFSRKADTCDDDDYIIDRGTTHVVYLIDDDVWENKNIEGYDTNVSNLKGFNRIQILKAALNIEIPPDVKSFDIRNPNVAIPAVETTYWCTIHKIPAAAENVKSHIIQTEPLITPENRGIIHHMEVFHCETDEEVPSYSGHCMGESAPFRDLEKCREVIGAWAMGASTFTYPAETGLAIGGESYSPYVRLEVHFNNPKERDGHFDSSGLRFYYTHNLRQFDTGIMELGLEYGPKNSIPAKQPAFTLSGYCIGECTKVALPEDGIHIFGGQLHTHNHGVQVLTRHFRNGIELPELARDDHYSTHFQEIRIYPKTAHVLPGDDLMTSCIYDTSDEQNITLSGYSIQEEMCVNYVYYYPKTDLEVCKSSIDTRALEAYFRLQKKLNGRYKRDINLQLQREIQEKYQSINFNQFETQLLKKIYDMAPLSMQCNQSNGERFPGNWEGKKQPVILYPLRKPRRNC